MGGGNSRCRIVSLSSYNRIIYIVGISPLYILNLSTIDFLHLYYLFGIDIKHGGGPCIARAEDDPDEIDHKRPRPGFTVRCCFIYPRDQFPPIVADIILRLCLTTAP